MEKPAAAERPDRRFDTMTLAADYSNRNRAFRICYRNSDTEGKHAYKPYNNKHLLFRC